MQRPKVCICVLPTSTRDIRVKVAPSRIWSDVTESGKSIETFLLEKVGIGTRKVEKRHSMEEGFKSLSHLFLLHTKRNREHIVYGERTVVHVGTNISREDHYALDSAGRSIPIYVFP